MAKIDAFYRRATSGYDEIANLDMIQTERMWESGYLNDFRWNKSKLTQ